MRVQKINNINKYIDKFYTNYFSINKNYIKCEVLCNAKYQARPHHIKHTPSY